MSSQYLQISYDLRKPGRDYGSLYDTIKTAPRWAHPVESVWFIYSPEGAAKWRDKLKSCMDTNDKLVVTTLRAGWATSGISSAVTDWMQGIS